MLLASACEQQIKSLPASGPRGCWKQPPSSRSPRSMTAYPKLVMRSETSCFCGSIVAGHEQHPPSISLRRSFLEVRHGQRIEGLHDLTDLRLTGDDDARTSPAKVGELERIPSCGWRRRSGCAESEAQSERYPCSVLTHSMDGRGEVQWSSPPTVRKREQRVVIYQLSLRVSVPRATASDGAGIEGLALLFSRSIWRRLNPTTLCDGVVP